MRLLIVTPEFPPHSGGGILKYYSELTPALVRAGLDVHVLVSAPSTDAFERYVTSDGVTVACVNRALMDDIAVALPQFSAAPDFRQWLASAWAARRVAEDLGTFDAIEATDFGFAFVPFLLGSAISPVVVRCHGSFGQLSRHEPRRPAMELDRALARLAEVTVLPLAEELQTYSQANADEWTERLDRVVSLVRPPHRLGNAGGSRGDVGIVVGRVQSWKGPETLCQALRVMRSPPVIRWVGRDTATGAGGTSLEADLRERYPDVWGRRVEWIGPRSREEVRARVETARFVVVPSTWDVFNFTAVEAMGAGRVVICGDGAGAAELITDGENGLVFPSGDYEALADSIASAQGMTESETAAMGRAARETVRALLDPDRVARAHVDGYAQLDCVRRPASDWIQDFYRPGSADRMGLEFLDQVDVRRVAGYLASRVGRRIGRPKTP